ncbi:MAG: hypothetical protein IJD25_03400 [Alphaproteobacteria bacterium]|nr:hypothetical protein [Alphaproteobacteria bacterium]
MTQENTPLISEKEFLRGIKYFLKHNEPNIFYSNKYLPALLKEFSIEVGADMKIFSTLRDLPKLESVIKTLHYAFGKKRLFLEKKECYPIETIKLLNETKENRSVYLTDTPAPLSFILIDNKHYCLKHHEKEGFLVALNANKDPKLQETLEVAIKKMNEIEENALLYQDGVKLKKRKLSTFRFFYERSKE